MKLPVAILAGGLAKRLRSLTETTPKAMLPVAGKPFIAHQLSLLHKRGIEQVILCIGYMGSKISNFVGDGTEFGLYVKYSLDGPVLLGTAGALKQALPLLGNAFFVLYGDSLLEIEYWEVQKTFITSRKKGLMTVYRNRGKWDKSNVLVENGNITRYDKQNPDPDMEFIDYGLGIITKEALSDLPENQPCDLSDVYKNLASQGELASYEAHKRFYEIGSQEGLRETGRYLSKFKKKD